MKSLAVTQILILRFYDANELLIPTTILWLSLLKFIVSVRNQTFTLIKLEDFRLKRDGLEKKYIARLYSHINQMTTQKQKLP